MWFAAASAASALFGGMSARSAQIKQMNTQIKAEGEAIERDRLNNMIQNGYRTAIAQKELGLAKKQLAQQGADVGTASVAAKGNAEVAAASTGSIGASTNAVISDIENKTNSALAQVQAEFENTLDNYNASLDAAVLNTGLSAPIIREVGSVSSIGSVFGSAAFAGLSSWAMNAMRGPGLGAQQPGGIASLGYASSIR